MPSFSTIIISASAIIIIFALAFFYYYFAIGFVPGEFFLYKEKAKIEPVQIEPVQNDEQLKEYIGQMIMAGFRGTEISGNSDIYKTIKEAKIGGVVLFDFDVPSKSFPRNIENKEQVKKLISSLQQISETSLFIAVDAEGGNVNRLKPKYGFLPIASAQKMGQDKTLKTARQESSKISSQLSGLGFNMNLAPVLDLNINPQNPIIGALGRSFSADPEVVFKNAKIFIASHSRNNIITVEKHFPGQGSAEKDTHLGIADITATYQQKELDPYKKLNEESLLSAIMVAHVIDKTVDLEFPATLSEKFLQGILRGKMGFEGVIFSDDLQMAAIKDNYEFSEAVILAINAGCDVISVLNNAKSGYDENIAQKTRDIIFKAVKEGKIKKERIIESYKRILSLKKKFRIVRPSAEEIKSEKFELLQVSENYDFGEIYSIAKNAEKLTGTRAALLLAVLQEELNLEKSDLCYLANLGTGQGVSATDGKKREKTMKPDRDLQDFIKITSELKKDPFKTLVTCPMSFGWGGAMGPADFIPSTWMRYKNKVENITGKPADPWKVEDSVLAMGFYLADSGAKLGTRKGEWEAAMIYFSNSPFSGYNFYADEVLAIADKIQKDISLVITP